MFIDAAAVRSIPDVEWSNIARYTQFDKEVGPQLSEDNKATAYESFLLKHLGFWVATGDFWADYWRALNLAAEAGIGSRLNSQVDSKAMVFGGVMRTRS